MASGGVAMIDADTSSQFECFLSLVPGGSQRSAPLEGRLGRRRCVSTNPATSDESRGTVALAEARARWTATLGRVSDHEGQFGERLGKPGGRRHVGPEIVEAPAEVLD